ncbi:pterin-4-alpha-carbinolamine dehydratase [Diplogelasinospora grovesii]|uniref:4a-hydroxytetrahydrobiopterin dehydratase n=1 Tax=Diplogelasinospora grovesii TaxID=303347 RepID=A0AAN6NEX0_9PEZI|nr:pterin-4-alpha-carbinolamine dehydratase [Diplogelasinospora grovesii]
MSSSMSSPKFSAGSASPATMEAKLAPLISEGGRWTLTANGEGLERTFKFKTFAKTWDFMTAVSLQCKLKNHHPEWSNVFSTTFIRWTTHNPRGLSSKDLELAAICDSLAKDFGEVVEDTAASSCQLTGLADKAKDSAGEDCCTPRPNSK